MNEINKPSLSEILGRADTAIDEVKKYAPPGLRKSDNVLRIAEFLVQCTWRELETIAAGVHCESKAMNEWAEGLVGDKKS